jgi:LysR family hydrogen peroxide-inducible transcriptional activator
MPTLRQFRYLDAVARLRHFGLAAEDCAVTQPALSTQIQELEKELGVELVERRYRNVRLTPMGEEIARRAQRILAEVCDLAEFARQQSSPLSGPLRLGVIPTIAPYLLPPVLPALRRDYPDLELHIRETQTSVLLGELLGGTLDLVLLALPIMDAGIDTLPLFEDRFILALPPDRGLTGPLQAAPELMQGDRLLLLEEGHCLRTQALSFCGLRQVGNIDTFGASSLSTIVQMVANGMGLTLLPEISIGVEARHGEVGLVRFSEPQPSRTIGLAWRRASPRKEDFAAFGGLIAELAPKVSI